MKLEKVDVVCVVVGLFMLAAYVKLQASAFLFMALVLFVPVLYFFFRDGIKIHVKEEEKKPSQ